MELLAKLKKGYGIPVLAAAFLLSGCGSENLASSEEPQQNKTASVEQTAMKTYEPPSMEKVPDGPLGESIKLGYKLMNETNTTHPNNVGNNLACSSCHGTARTDATSPLTGVTAVYPTFNPRAGKVLTFEDRINGCFKRSMNGHPLEAASDEMRAMVAYLNYISTNVPIGIKERPWIIKIRSKPYQRQTLQMEKSFINNPVRLATVRMVLELVQHRDLHYGETSPLILELAWHEFQQQLGISNVICRLVKWAV